MAINAKEIIKNAKNKSKIEFINTINSESNIATVWNNIKRFRGSYHPTSTPLITPTAIVTVAKQKTQLFADKFETVFKCTGGIARADGEDGRVATDMGGDHILEYNCPFEKHELVSVLVNLKGTSPGVNFIHNEFLKNLPTSYVDLLLHLVNAVWHQTHIPSMWKRALITIISKKDKPPDNIESFRPISLLPCMGKVIEKMVGRTSL